MTDKQIIIDGVDISMCDCFIEKMDRYEEFYFGLIITAVFIFVLCMCLRG